jgi:hypothetical protein
MTQPNPISNVAPVVVHTLLPEELDSRWPEFASMFRASSSGTPKQIEQAERAALELARSGVWCIWIASGVGVSAATQLFDNADGFRTYSVLPFFDAQCGPEAFERGREAFERVLLERIEGHARAIGCTHIEVQYGLVGTEPDKHGYLATLTQVLRKDLRQLS